MKQNWTMYTYKADKRYKEGKRLLFTRVLTDMTEQDMKSIVSASAFLHRSKGYTFEYFPTTRTVKNLMTGAMVEIPYDTPRSCDPSSELFWTM
jgi:hypothetical protein